MNLTGKVAIVTGGGTGIGRAISLALAARGAMVAVNFSRSAVEAEATAARINSSGGHAVAVQADIADDAAVRAMVGLVAERFGGVDVLVNNAGTTRFIPMSDLESVTDEVWDRIFDVNVKGAFYCARAVAPHMKARGGGAIVTISSDSGYSGLGSSLPYAVSKAAAIGLTRSLAHALAPEIRVCAVAPGWVSTRWTAGREELVERGRQAALLQRTAAPEDVAAMVIALLENDAITGQTVIVDGGTF